MSSSKKKNKKRKKVLVSGCFDLLHSGHVKFFEEASKLGDLYVCLGTDENIESLKHHKTMYPNEERLYMVQAIKYVHHVRFSSGTGDIDFEPDLDDIRPDIFYVNDDGDREAKRIVIAKRPWIKYVVAKRTAKKGLKIRSSTQLKIDLKQKKQSKASSSLISNSTMAIFALCLVSIQVGIQPFLTERFVPRQGIKTSIVIIQEAVKAICCLIALLFSGNLMNVFSAWKMSNSLRVACIPAIIYCLQNVLAYYAYLQLDPLTFNLINQSKLVFAAFFLKIILNKTPTMRQMTAFSILLLSSILLTIDTTNAEMKNLDPLKNGTYGLIAIVIASISSGLAGTLTQKALQSEKKPRNSLLFSIELAMYGILFSFFRLFVEYKMDILDGSMIGKNGFFDHLDAYVLIPITVNGIGGIGVGLITKYTSVLHKSYSMIFGILLSGIFRSFLYFEPMSNAMIMAVPMVMFSMWLNATSKVNKSKKKKKKKQ